MLIHILDIFLFYVLFSYAFEAVVELWEQLRVCSIDPRVQQIMYMK